MYNANRPSADELPSAGRLLRSTAIAIVAAAAILLTVVLPSEYGIDPTGAGRILGLTEMGEIKMQLAKEAEADRRQAETETSQSTPTSDQLKPQAQTETAVVARSAPRKEKRPSVAVTAPRKTTQPAEQAAPARVPAASAEVAPSAGPETRSDEISITLSPGQGTEIKLVMEKGARARFEWTANGGRLNYDTHGDGSGQSISYEKGRGVAGDEGVLVAAFDGKHGWFWRNRTRRNVTLTLRTNGAYRELKRVL
ncbi:MAG: transmembrane anchor protein [Alphaproteobacteria bacterium]|nr:transmembrane anchor protein [Alphaproteobacteria bacterium]